MIIIVATVIQTVKNYFHGYNKKVIEEYNKDVIDRLKKASKFLEIPIDRFMPKDKKGNKRPLGIFELEKQKYNDNSYIEFITQGAKKYAYIERIKNEKVKKDYNVISKDKEYSNVLKITVSGVPKIGAKCLKDLKDFKDNLVFDFETTNKNIIMYNDFQDDVELTDYLGNTELIEQGSGACLLPTTYILGKSEEYADLIDWSSNRSIYRV